MKKKTHYIRSICDRTTVCGKIEWEVATTKDKEKVTCEKCKKSERYKNG